MDTQFPDVFTDLISDVLTAEKATVPTLKIDANTEKKVGTASDMTRMWWKVQHNILERLNGPTQRLREQITLQTKAKEAGKINDDDTFAFTLEIEQTLGDDFQTDMKMFQIARKNFFLSLGTDITSNEDPQSIACIRKDFDIIVRSDDGRDDWSDPLDEINEILKEVQLTCRQCFFCEGFHVEDLNEEQSSSGNESLLGLLGMLLSGGISTSVVIVGRRKSPESDTSES